MSVSMSLVTIIRKDIWVVFFCWVAEKYVKEIVHKRSRTPYFCYERSCIAFSTTRHIFVAERSFNVPQKSTRDRERVSSRARSIVRYKDGLSYLHPWFFYLNSSSKIIFLRERKKITDLSYYYNLFLFILLHYFWYIV